MKILILQAYEKSYIPLANISNTNKQQYAYKHGYDFLPLEVNWNDIKGATWIIPATICNILNDKYYKDYDYILWTDVDSLIMNFDIKLEDIIEQGKQSNIIANIWNFDLNYTFVNLNGDIDIVESKSSWFMIHTGNWLIKNNEENKKFFNILCTDKRFLKKELATNPMGDELALTTYYLSQPNIRTNFCFLSSETFITLDNNESKYLSLSRGKNISLYKEGNFIIHYPFIPLPKRIQLMENII